MNVTVITIIGFVEYYSLRSTHTATMLNRRLQLISAALCLVASSIPSFAETGSLLQKYLFPFVDGDPVFNLFVRHHI